MPPAGQLGFVDSHNDLLLGVHHQRERGHADPFGDFWLPQLRAGGVVVQVLPIFTEDQFIGEAALRHALLVIETARWMARQHEGEVALVESAAELREAIEGGRIALILAFEGMEPVGSSVDVIDAFWRLGIRMASLTWNRRTMLADGTGEADTGAGLSNVGVAAVARMEELGMIVDVSHLSDAGFDHISRIADRPFVASHSSCRALQAHPRNLTDERLRAVAASGGYVGINAIAPFCADEATPESYVDHIEHAVGIIGREHVGLGLDFVADLFEQLDPILGEALVDTSKLPVIDGLQRPDDLAALGPRLVERFGHEDAEWVASRATIEMLERLLPA